MKNFLLIIALTYIPNICFASQLIKAIENNSTTQAHTLLKSGIDPNQPGVHNTTPLMRASILNNIEMTKLLLKYKANPNKTNIAQTTALHLASRKGNYKIVELLIDNNANINAQDFSGYTPLMRAISTNKHHTTEILLEHNAKTLVTNNHDQNSFDIAIEAGNQHLIPLLIQQLNYQNIKYLKKLHTRVTRLNNKTVATTIEEKILSLESQKNTSEQKITMTYQQVKEKTPVTSLSNFPCLNDEITQVKIQINHCVNSNTKIILTQTPIKKPIKFIPVTGQLTALQIINHTVIEKKVPLSWKTENLAPIKKSITTPTPLISSIPPNITSNATNYPIPIARSHAPTPITLSTPLKKPNNISTTQPKKIIALQKQKPTTITKTIPNLNHTDISNYAKIANIRTNEWSINPRTIPLSIIDFDNLGPDLLFNRKYEIPYEKEIKQTKKINKTPPKNSKAIKPVTKSRKGYFIQIGTYANFDNAKRIAEKAKKYGNSFFSKGTLKNKKVLKVLIGPFNSQKNAQSIRTQKEFKQLFGSKTIIRKF